MYDYEIDLRNTNTSHTKILNQINSRSDVLEVGCSTGYMTRHLKEELECRVTCVEIDSAAAQLAAQYCDRFHVGDIEEIIHTEFLDTEGFDTIILADVLEHLKDPDSLLKVMRALLRPTGFLLLSVPNGAHGAIAIEMIEGRWQYRDQGLLDRTHLRFYDRKSIASLLDRTGYHILELDRVKIHPRDTEIKTRWEEYPGEITRYIEKANPEYDTYQFVLKAYLATESGVKAAWEETLNISKKENRELSIRINTLEKELSNCREDFEVEKGRIREVYEQKILQIEEEKREIHQGYERQILSLETEKEEFHRAYNNQIAQIADSYHEEMIAIEAEKTVLSDTAEERKREMESCQSSLADLLEQKVNFERKFADCQEELDEMKASSAWQLVHRYRCQIERFLPPNTRRRRIYSRIISVNPVFLAERVRPFLRGVRGHFFPAPDSSASSGSTQSSSDWFPLIFPPFDPKVSIIIPVFNQFSHTFRCLQSLLRHTNVAYEIILIDNGSTDETAEAVDGMEGIRVIRHSANEGFVAACNRGADAAKGEFLLLLNNDTEVRPGWLEAMLSTFEDRSVGVVGAKLIYPDGRLQEAGGIIWSDGTGWNYGRNDQPDSPEYCYTREVDYCSGACLMIRRSLWKEIGGFDLRYAPAYYEDTDLCFSVRQHGYKVIYQPEARIIHYEGASAGTDISSGYKKYQQTNWTKFQEKWQKVLEREHFSGPEYLYAARELGKARQVLVVDHYVPAFDKDSGSLRMFSLLRIMKDLGLKVAFWPENRALDSCYTPILQRLGVEVLYGDLDFESYLKINGRFIDTIFLSRPHIAVHFIDAAKSLTEARVIYDTVDLHFLREERRICFEDCESNRTDANACAEKWRRIEFSLFQKADQIVVVSPVEKEILEEEGLAGKVSVISNIHSVNECRKPFEQRSDLMFIGGFTHPPNGDGIIWFVESIFPLICRKLPGISLNIVGSNPDQRIRSLASGNICVTGYVADVAPYFHKARVFVSPLRYGAGVKGKIGHSLSFGLPVVTTPIGAEGMGLIDGDNAMIANDEEDFAEKVVRLYENTALWLRLSENGKNLIQKQYSPDVMKVKLRQLLEIED